tara:strand:- start:205 stop:417 length:213 start_codon:yes stop_codon:yes gene_type:complete
MTKQYEIEVYRTIQQHAVVTVETDRDMDDPTDLAYLQEQAEREAYHLSDYEWRDGPIDTMYFSEPKLHLA